MADCTLDDWIERHIDYEESELDVSTLSIYDFCFSNQGAIDILTDEIKNEDFDLGYMYMDRIFNSEDPYTEIRKVIDEITILILEQTIDELKEVYNVKSLISAYSEHTLSSQCWSSTTATFTYFDLDNKKRTGSGHYTCNLRTGSTPLDESRSSYTKFYARAVRAL